MSRIGYMPLEHGDEGWAVWALHSDHPGYHRLIVPCSTERQARVIAKALADADADLWETL